MKIKYSALVSDARGKLNGSVASKNRYGNYLRNKITPTNPQTSAQSRMRALFGSISKGWGALTQAQRNLWEEFSHQHPYNDIFGDSKVLQGSAMYQRVNLNLSKLEKTLLVVPGAVSDIAPLEQVQALMEIGGGGDIEDMQVAGVFDDTTTENQTMVVYATPPISPGRSFVKNDFRLIDWADGDGIDTRIIKDITDKYVETFGDSVPDDYKVFVRIAILDIKTGLQGPVWQEEFVRQ